MHLGRHQVSTRTIVDFNLSISSLNLAIRTDLLIRRKFLRSCIEAEETGREFTIFMPGSVERTTCILKQYGSHLHIDQPGHSGLKGDTPMTMTATSMRYSTAKSSPAVYYAGYDPGSRIATLYLAQKTTCTRCRLRSQYQASSAMA